MSNFLRRLIVLCVVALASSAFAKTPADPGSIFSLRAYDQLREIDHLGGDGLLFREIVRQSLLIAARDGMGLATRDEALREPLGVDPLCLNTRNSANQLHLFFDYGDNTTTLWSGDVAYTTDADNHPMAYTSTMAQCEQWSRGAWIDLLKKLGYHGSPNKIVPVATAPKNSETLLANFDLLSQFIAVRQAHIAIRESGESPERLGVLVRGYAHLGRLTELHWNASAKVFKARALLYAYRMVATNPHSALALQHRAYAYAWAGYPQHALEDLAAAEKPSAAATQPSAPAWVSLIEPFSKCNPGALAKVGSDKPQLAAEAALLAFFTVENCVSYQVVFGYGNAALALNPTCLRVVDSVNQVAGFSEGNRPTLAQFGIFAQTMDHLREVPGIDPQSAAPREYVTANSLPNAGNYATTIKSLRAQDDRSEPSLPCLCRLVEETCFYMSEQRAMFMYAKWGVDPGDFLVAIRPMIADHPNRAAIEWLCGDRNSTARNALLTGFSPADPSVGVYEFCHQSDYASPSIRQTWNRMFRSLDNIVYDGEFLLSRSRQGETLEYRVNKAKALLVQSPYSAVARAVLIDVAWEQVHDQARKWEQEQGDHPSICTVLAVHYDNAGDAEKSDIYLRKLITIAPEKWAYEMLAWHEFARGNQNSGAAIMNAFLEKSHGLERAQGQVDLANYYISKKEFHKARELADDAATSYAASAMQCAASADEGDGDYAAAEKWVKAEADRYSLPFTWYFWCQRTGRGDLAAARALAEVAAKPTSSTPRGILNDAYIFYLLEGRTADARAILDRICDDGEPFQNFHLAILADAAHDTAARDAALQRIIEKGPLNRSAAGRPRGEMIAVAALIKRHLAADDFGNIDKSEFNLAMQSAGEGEQAQIAYFIARFMSLHGQQDVADSYLRFCASSPEVRLYNRLLAIKELQSRKLPVPTTREWRG